MTRTLMILAVSLSLLFPAIADDKARFAKFEKDLTGVKLVGLFTIDGQEGQSKEEFTIHNVKKLPGKDLWLFTARVNYGG